MRLAILVGVSDDFLEPILPDDEFPNVVERFLSQRKLKRTNDIMNSVYTRTNTDFEEFLLNVENRHTPVALAIGAIRGLGLGEHATCSSESICVIPYREHLGNWVHLSSYLPDTESYVIKTSSRDFDLVDVQRKLLLSHGQVGSGLWQTLDEFVNQSDSVDETRVIVVGSKRTMHCFEAIGATSSWSKNCLYQNLFASILVYGPGGDGEDFTKAISAMNQFAASHGGFYMQADSTVYNSVDQYANIIKQSFVCASVESLKERRIYASEALSEGRKKIQVERDQRSSKLDRIYQCPTYVVHQCLLHSEWRWTRGLRFYREFVHGVRDVVVDSAIPAGPVGLELIAGSWTVHGCHPPISGLGIEIGSALICVNQTPITPETNRLVLHRLMAQRPVCFTVQEKNRITPSIDSLINWMHMMAEELACAVLSRREKKPIESMPPPFKPSRQRPWKTLDKCNIQNQALIMAATVTCDLRALQALACTCRQLNEIIEHAGELSLNRFQRYIVRRSSASISESSSASGNNPPSHSKKAFVVYGTTAANDPVIGNHPFTDHSILMKFLAILQAVQAAAFVYSQDITTTLYREGFPIELAFARLVLQISTTTHGRLREIYRAEGVTSIFWVRILLILLKRIQICDDVLKDSFEQLDITRVTDDVIKEAIYVPVTSKWFREWNAIERATLG